MNGLRCLQHLTVLIIYMGWSGTNSQTISEGVDKVTQLSNDLLPRLLSPLLANQQNVIIGPFGVANNLALLLEASYGETRQEILAFLNLTVDDIALLRVGFKGYCELFLAHSSNPDAAGAYNSASIRSDFSLDASLMKVMKDYYCCTITGNVTDGPTMSLESHSGVMTHWKAFEKLAVYTFLSHQDIRPFTRKDGISVPVPMIPQVGVFRTGNWEQSMVLQLPLETNMVDLILIVPQQQNKIDSIIKLITSSTVSEMLNKLEEREMEVFIPQFTSTSKQINLSGVLHRGGIRRAFQPLDAQLVHTPQRNHTFIEKITQDAYISTSFTSLNSVAGAFLHYDALSQRRRRSVNKVYMTTPFIFLVVHKDTHLILLAGKIENPSSVPN